MLRLAGREADVVGINASLRAGHLGAHAVVDLSHERVARKLEWVAEGAAASGRTLHDLELEMNVWLARVTPDAAAAAEFVDRVATRMQVDPRLLWESPSVLVGTAAQIIDTLVDRREQLGLNYFQLDAGFPVPDLEAFAPVIEQLTGT